MFILNLAEVRKNLKIGGIEDARINHRQCNGSDVVELAVMSACMQKRNRKYFISFEGSYHGQNLTAYFVSHIQTKHKFFNNKEDIIFLKNPTSAISLLSEELTDSEQATLQELEKYAPNSYGIILEPIQVNCSVNIFSTAFVKKIKQICSDKKICLIFDETQTGFGWLGKLTAAEIYGVTPNIIVLAKAITAGYGSLAVIVSDKEYAINAYGTSEKTNGADLRSLVAAEALLDRLIGADENKLAYVTDPQLKQELQTGLLKSVHEKSKALEKKLLTLQRKFPRTIKSIRGEFLIRGIEITDIFSASSHKIATSIKEDAFNSGLFIRISSNYLIIKPPLVINNEQLSEGMKRLANSIRKVELVQEQAMQKTVETIEPNSQIIIPVI